jgi:hypothetical protein
MRNDVGSTRAGSGDAHGYGIDSRQRESLASIHAQFTDVLNLERQIGDFAERILDD